MEKEELLQDPVVIAAIEEAKSAVEQQVRQEVVADKANLVKEIKELRVKRGLDPETGNAIVQPTAPDEFDTKVQEVLKKEKQKEAVANRSAALSNFFAQNKEFHPDNDPAGLKFKLIETELQGLKEDGLSSVEDFVRLFNKAKNLAMANNNEEQGRSIATDPSSGTTAGKPRATESSKLSPDEQRFIAKHGWTEERYLKLKNSGRPDMDKYLDSLLRQG